MSATIHKSVKIAFSLKEDERQELLICSVSGGKDSTALYCLMTEFYGENFIAVFADTGNEHPVTINYVKNLHLMANGPKVEIVKADLSDRLRKKGVEPTGNPFLDLCLWKGRVPSVKAQFCTEWVKLYPIKLWLEENFPLDDYVMFTGIRAGESAKRAKRMPFEWNRYFDCENINPLLYESEECVFSYLREKGVPPNPLYSLGFGRVGCFPCIHANKTELSLLPDWAWDKLEEWESRIGRSWFSAGTVPKIHIPTISDVRNWCKTSHGGKQFDLFKSIEVADAPHCMSTWGVCE